MKKLFLFVCVWTTISYADLSVEQIHKMVLKIHEKREGIKLKTLNNTKEPFVQVEIENNESTYVAPKKKDIKLLLHAILNNRAYINNKWLALEDIINGYRLKYIGKSGVVLRKEKRIKKLFLNKSKAQYISIEKKD